MLRPDSDVPTGATSPGSWSLLANRGFEHLWLAGGLAGISRWFETLATGIFAYQLTGSALWVSTLLFVRLIPMLILGAFIGALAHLATPRGLLSGLAALLAGTYTGLAVLAAAGTITPAYLLLACIASGCFWAAETPVRRTMLAEVAGIGSINVAMSIELATFYMTRMLGPATGGVIFEQFGMAGVYCVSAGFSIAAALLIWRAGVGSRLESIGQASSLGDIVRNFQDGIQFIRKDHVIQATLYCTVMINVFCLSYVAAVPVIGESKFKATAFSVGLLMSAEGIGAFLASIAIGLAGRAHHFAKIFFCGSSLYLACILAFSLATNVGWGFAFLVVGGIGAAGFGSMQSTLILSRTPPPLRNHVMGVLMIFVGFGPVGVLALGVLMHLLEASLALTVVTGAGLLGMMFAVVQWPGLLKTHSPN
jgi:MFS family permease